jgi:ribonuclease BN (tRNA processing enzyme)
MKAKSTWQETSNRLNLMYDIHKKATAVILSCTTKDHIAGATNFVDLATKYYRSQYSTIDKNLRILLDSYIAGLYKVLKIKNKSIFR